MKILKALQRKKQEEQSNIVPLREVNKHYETSTSFLPEDIKIGTPKIITEQEESFVESQKIKIPEFASWPIQLEDLDPRLVSLKAPSSVYCENYRNLRTKIFQKSQRNNLKVITISSINPNEGKSITALNLACLMAQTEGSNTLLIDGDLRKPSLAKYLGFETDKGLSELISGEAKIEETIICLEPTGLYLLPGSSPNPKAPEILSGVRFKQLISQLRQMFDYILIDSPPLAICSDADVLTSLSDGTIFVIRSNYTQYLAVTRALEMLPQEKILGVVLNESEDSLKKSYYDFSSYDSNDRETL
ncbi:MAG: CpsD/CapB family tyrosine-protein kinase [Pyrinomonadaceae bacterium]|nr:CpsD/CapB family tyrosine-protein kinase [Pyrinomonadaceae bacterium]MCX7638933.1 CpsD/CapB family tyrosine-protein kinase [Pyrinomonadaceae bacterium]MDW8304930.1 CpsD/CapB family tyrosine-protein kinase [Acidobacteriota bacterium]